MLHDKTVLITGSTRGIGRSVAELFAQNRANIVLNARNEEKANQIADKLVEEYNVKVDIVLFDVSNHDEVKNGFRKLFKIVNKLDIVVNNAGILESSLIGMLTEKVLKKTYETNVYGLYYVSQYAARMMNKNKEGSIINITSIMGVNGAEGQTAYSGSKAAVIGITKSLAKELAPDNIRVNAIAPGFIDTDMARNLSEEKFKERMSSIKMGRIGKPRDVAKVALFLASDLSEYVTGQTIGVDGGMLI